MTYLLLLFLILTILFMQETIPKIKSILDPFLMLLIFLPIGLRGDVGTDTFYYGQIFNDLMLVTSLHDQILFRYEPIPVFLMYVTGWLTNSYSIYLLIYALVSAVFFHTATNNMRGRSLFIIFYLLIVHLVWNANAMRFGLSFLFLMNAYKYRDNFNKKIIFAAAGLLSHLSILVFYPVLIKIKIDKRIMIFVFTFLVIIWFKHEYLALKIIGYGFFDSKLTISFLGVMMVGALWVGMALKKDRSYELIVASLIFSIVMLLSGYNDIMYRILQPAVIFLLYIVFYELDIKSLKIPLVMAVFLIGTYFSISYVFAVKNERSVILSTGAGGILEFTLLPYSGFCSSQYRFDDPLFNLLCK